MTGPTPGFTTRRLVHIECPTRSSRFEKVSVIILPKQDIRHFTKRKERALHCLQKKKKDSTRNGENS